MVADRGRAGVCSPIATTRSPTSCWTTSRPPAASELGAFLRWRQEQQVAAYADEVDGDDVRERLEQLAGALSRDGYRAEVEADGEALTLRQQHCTIAKLAADQPLLCAHEAAAFGRLLGDDVRVTRRETIAKGDGACVCHVQLRDAAAQHTPGHTRRQPDHLLPFPLDHRGRHMSTSEIPLPAPADAPEETARDRQQQVADDLKDYKFGWSDSDEGYSFTSGRGLTAETVEAISDRKDEPEWMNDLRLRAFKAYERRPMPNWGSDLSGIAFDDIYYYVEASEGQVDSWEDLPPEIMETYEKLGIPEAERKRLIAGVAAQYESTVLYHKIREDLEEEGVIFLDTDEALKQHEELFRKHFGTVIPPNDNKFAALNTAVWSGGSFIWIPEGVKVDIPLQAYFRINKQNMGQFERTLIIAEPGSYVHYVEGCTAPIYSSDSLHSAVVEIIVKEGARVRYTTIQNWSNNVYNLVTKRAVAEKNATMEWIDGNIGSKVTMKYPAVWLTGEGAKGEVLSVAYANDGQHQDAGAKMVHAAPNTTSNILSKSISKGKGRTSYRGLVRIEEGATNARAAVKCDALMLDDESRSDTYPYMEIDQDDATIEHEATVSKLSEDQLFYLQARGIDEDEATAMIVRGFIEPIARELPMEYAVELNRLIEIEMEGAIG